MVIDGCFIQFKRTHSSILCGYYVDHQCNTNIPKTCVSLFPFSLVFSFAVYVSPLFPFFCGGGGVGWLGCTVTVYISLSSLFVVLV